MTRWCWIAVVLALVVARPAAAYRPFDGTDADVADVGEFELELGPVGYAAAPGARILTLGAFVANLGLAPRWELVLEGRGQAALGAFSGSHRLALGDTALFGKHVFREGVLQDRPGVSAAVEFGPLLPGVFADPGVGGQLAAIASYRWSMLTMHVNGAARMARTGQPGAFAGWIVEGPTDWRARPVAELAVDKGRWSAAAYSALAGVLWQIADTVVVDGALRTVRSATSSGYEVRAGLTWGWRVWGP